LLYHGLSDPDISAVNTLNYYHRVEDVTGANTRNFARLFLVPGMQHCGGGPGTDSFDAQAAMQRWVEENQAPDRIVASHYAQGVVERTRPLCPYPLTAAYAGKGNATDATSWVCKAPSPVAKK
jgi:feruloyl esterase